MFSNPMFICGHKSEKTMVPNLNPAGVITNFQSVYTIQVYCVLLVLKSIKVNIKIITYLAFVRKFDRRIIDSSPSFHMKMMIHATCLLQLNCTATTMMGTYYHVWIKIGLNMKAVFAE